MIMHCMSPNVLLVCCMCMHLLHLLQSSQNCTLASGSCKIWQTPRSELSRMHVFSQMNLRCLLGCLQVQLRMVQEHISRLVLQYTKPKASTLKVLEGWLRNDNASQSGRVTEGCLGLDSGMLMGQHAAGAINDHLQPQAHLCPWPARF